jgi:8-oxo-dGTP diphosphatase
MVTKELKNFIFQGDKIYLSHISLDCVIFGFHENQLKVLLLKWKEGPWCLPGGFIKHDESVDDSAIRVLHERTGLKNIYLQQFHTFGHPMREKGKKATDPKSWMSKRFISIGYYALVEFSKVKALEAIRLDLNDHPVGYNLLPEKFTMPELQRLYETILDEKLDRRNFQKKILAMDFLIRLEERKTGGAHKAPFLYKFDKKKYSQALKQGLKSSW